MTNLLAAALPHGQFWAILPSYATATALELKNEDYEAHVAHYNASLAVKAENPVSAEERRYSIQNGTAVIRIDGVMTKRPTSYGRGTSTLLARRAIEQAAIDTDVRSILIVADSPGGSVDGVQDLHDAIARVQKPVKGHIDGGAYSAAMWALVACNAGISIGRSDSCGSLGVMAVLADTSKMADEEGVEVLLFATGELKGQGTDGVPISPAARQMYQAHVDTLGEFFAASIARGRNLSSKQVEKVFTGAIFSAQDALKYGLVDSIATLDEAIASLDVTEDDEPTEDLLARFAHYPNPEYAAIMFRGKSIEEQQRIEAAYDAQHAKYAAEIAAEEAAAVPASTRDLPPTISTLTGGEPRPRAGTAEPSASENQHMDNWKNRLADAFRSRGKGVVASSLDNSTREDPESTARVVSDSIDAQVQEIMGNDPLMRGMKARGINTLDDLNAFADLHAVGAQALKTAREDAAKACIAAKGADRAAIIAKQLDTQPYAVVMQNLEAWNAEADAQFGNDAKNPAKRQTAPGGALAADVEEAKAPKRRWERMDKDDQAKAMKDYGLDTPEKQDEFAARLPDSLLKEEN